jgi:hypothetical protein
MIGSEGARILIVDDEPNIAAPPTSRSAAGLIHHTTPVVSST